MMDVMHACMHLVRTFYTGLPDTLCPLENLEFLTTGFSGQRQCLV